MPALDCVYSGSLAEKDYVHHSASLKTSGHLDTFGLRNPLSHRASRYESARVEIVPAGFGHTSITFLPLGIGGMPEPGTVLELVVLPFVLLDATRPAQSSARRRNRSKPCRNAT